MLETLSLSFFSQECGWTDLCASAVSELEQDTSLVWPAVMWLILVEIWDTWGLVFCSCQASLPVLLDHCRENDVLAHRAIYRHATSRGMLNLVPGTKFKRSAVQGGRALDSSARATEHQPTCRATSGKSMTNPIWWNKLDNLVNRSKKNVGPSNLQSRLPMLHGTQAKLRL